MKVLLLYPPRYRRLWSSREHKDGYFNEPHNPYFGLSILAVARQAHPDVVFVVHDAQLDNEDFETVERRVREINPDLLVCMLNFACLDEDRRYLAFPYPTVGVLQAYIDHREAVTMYGLQAMAVTKGEAEETVTDAIGEFRQTGQLEKTRGLLIRRPDGTIADTGDRVLPEIAKFPMPAFDLVDINRYMDLQRHHSGTSYIFLYTTRGCPFQCSYCSAGTKAYAIVRKKSVDQVIAEMKYFIALGHKNFYFYDDEFAIDMKRAKAICRRIIDEKLDIKWACYNTTNLVDEELISLMAASGCHLIRYGVESGDMELHRKLDTYLDEAEVLKAFDLTHKYGIFVDTFILVGLPGETHESLKKTYRLLRRVRPDRITTSVLFPKPYSRMYKEMQRDGRLLEPDWSKHVFSPTLTFKHDTYADIGQIRRAEQWIRIKMLRYLAVHDLVHNRTGRNLYSRTVRVASSFTPVRRLIDATRKRHPGIHRFLQAPYQGYSKFRV